MALQNGSKKNLGSYDVTVIGGRLSGLIAGALWARKGARVALVHNEPEWGREFKVLQTPSGPVVQGLNLLPFLPESAEELDALNKALDTNLCWQEIPSPLQTFEGGKFKPLLGFGSQAPECLPLLEAYLAPQLGRIPSEHIVHLIDQCLASEGLDQLRPHEVTLLTPEGGSWGVELDGQKLISTSRVLWADPPPLLSQTLRKNSGKPTKEIRRLSKWESWSSLSLTLLHQDVQTEPNPPGNLLMGTKLEPCLGLFDAPITSPEGSTTQASHWMTLLPSELAESEESCAHALREMKKQIKRAFPRALEETIWEKITVQIHSHGLPLGSNGGELGLPGLECLGSAFSDHPHPLWGELLSARKGLLREADGEPEESTDHLEGEELKSPSI